MDAYKLVLVAFGGIVLMSNLIQVLIALYHNRYQPFKCKQPIVLLVGVLAAALGWIGNLQQNGIINQISIFQNCSVWTVFVQYCLGSQLLLSVLTYRMLRLYYIVVKKRSPTGYLFYTIHAAVFIPAVYCGILALLFPGRYLTVQPIVLESSFRAAVCNFLDHIYIVCIFCSTFLQLLLLTVP